MLKTETYFVAFIDILGFTEIIKKYDKGLLPDVLFDLKSALDSAASFLKMDLSNTKDPLSWKKSLSDYFGQCVQ